MQITKELLAGKIAYGFSLNTLNNEPADSFDSVSPFHVFDEESNITITSEPTSISVSTESQALYSFSCTAFGETEVSCMLWFDFSDDLWPGTLCLLHTDKTFSGDTLKTLGWTVAEWILIANSNHLNYSSFCDALKNEPFDSFSSKFEHLPPKIGINYNGSITLADNSVFQSLSDILPKSLDGVGASVRYYKEQEGAPAAFDIEIFIGKIGQPPVLLDQLVVGLSISEGDTVEGSEVVASLRGKLSKEDVSLEFNGSYPLKGDTDISVFGALTSSIANPVQPELQIKGTAAISFNKSFAITSYMFGASLDNIADLIPEFGPGKPIIPEIIAAGLRVSGENFEAAPQVVLDFSTKLFNWLPINTSLLYPEKIIKARLAPPVEEHKLAELLRHFGWDSPPKALSEFVLKDLELTADLPAKDFSFKIEIGSDYRFGDLFTLNDLLGYFHYRGAIGTIPAQYDFLIEGTFDIGGIDFLASVSFAKDSGGSSLTLSAEHAGETPISIGKFIDKIAAALSDSSASIPDAISGLTIDTIGIEFTNDAQKTIAFKLYGSLPINGKELSVRVDLTATEAAGEKSRWTFAFGGAIAYSGYELDLQFSNENGTSLLASLKNANESIEVGHFLKEYVPDDMRGLVPEISIGFKDAFIGFHKPSPAGKYSIVLGLDINLGAGLDFSTMPVVGELLKEQHLGINNLRIVGCVADLPETGVTALNNQLAKAEIGQLDQPRANGAPVPSAAPVPLPATEGTQANPFKRGIYLSANIQVPGLDEGVPVHVEFSGSNSGTTQKVDANDRSRAAMREPDSGGDTKTIATTTRAAATPNPGITPVGRQLGPFFLESIALGMEAGKVKLEFTGGFLAGPVGMQVIGFSVSSPLTAFEPEFDLKGLSLGLDKPPLTISGALLKNFYTTTKAPIQTVKEYSGAVSIGFKQFSLVALGAFAEVTEGRDTFKSLFIYGFLGAPIGGPPFLFVTGLAAGFGYNRRLNLPDVDQIDRFPLIAIAKAPVGTAPTASDLKKLLDDLKNENYIPPSQGDYWFAIGLRVESFKMINSFVVLALQFGHELEIDVLGISTMQFPISVDHNVKPVAKIVIGLKARILPERGIIDIRGALLPGTYILDENARLTGGFAMLAIMKDQTHGEWNGGKAGEFIITVGGYGPWYQPKPYYPRVPRLELNWRVSDLLNIHADAYFAITPEAMMVGGHLVLDFYSGGDFSVRVHLALGVDFIIYWQPLHYIAQAHAELRVSATINVLLIHETVSFDMGADLTLWGPPFAGYADVHAHFLVSFSFTVEFGEREIAPGPLSWTEFETALLPEKTKILTITVQEGRVVHAEAPSNEELPKDDKPVVLNPKEARFSISSVIPLKAAEINGESEQRISFDNAKQDFGIKSMGLTSEDFFVSKLTVTINYGGKLLANPAERFEVVPIFKNMPAAMWQPAKTSKSTESETGIDLIPNLLCGFEFCAKPAKLNEKKYSVPLEETADELEGKSSSWIAGNASLGLYDKQEVTCHSALDSIFN